MQFNEKVQEVLGNFSTINQSIVFKPGSEIATMSPMKTMVAKAKSDVIFTDTFGVYDLSRFLAAISKLDTPIVSKESAGVLKIGSKTKRKLNWPVCEPSLVVTPPDKGVQLPSKDVEFKLSKEAVKEAVSFAGVLSAPQLIFRGDGTTLFIEVLDVKNPAAPSSSDEIGKTDKTFRMVFESDNIKLLPRDYNVTISKKGLSHFEAEDVEYYIAVEATSTFED